MAVPGALAEPWLPGTAASQVVVFTVAKAGVKHSIIKKNISEVEESLLPPSFH